MKIIRRYILGSIVLPFVLSLFLFTVLLLILRLVKIAEMVLVKGADPLSVVLLLGLMAVYLLNYTIPISSLVSVTLAFGRLSTDNELMAFRASGISLMNLLRPVFAFGLLLCFVSLGLNDRVLPAVHLKIADTLYSIGKKKPASLLAPGTFVNYFEKYILYLGRIDGEELFDVKIYEILDSGQTRIIIARTGTIFPGSDTDESVTLVLRDGRIDQPEKEGQQRVLSLNFEKYEVKLVLRNKKKPADEENDIRGMTLTGLLAEKQRMASLGFGTLPVDMEYHTRLAVSFASLVFIIAGLAFSLTVRRREKSINFAYSVAVIVLYYIFSAAGVAFSLTGKVPPVLCAWLGNIIIGAAGAVTLWRRHE